MKDITIFMKESLNGTSNKSFIITEGEVNNEKEFREFAAAMAKEAFGDKYDESKLNKTVDGFLEDNKELVDKGEWAELVGMWKQGFTK